MEKIRSSPLSIVFPWLSPLVIKFALVNGGIEVLLYKNNQPVKNWQTSMLRHVLPEQLIRWIEDYHIYSGPQPYPLIKQLWQYLLPLASKKLIIDSSVLAELEEVSQPQDFALTWSINRSLMCIEGRYEGADRYLGMGWFHKGRKIWSLNHHPSNAADVQLKNLMMPVEQADVLMKSIIPDLQYYLPTRADFQLIADFAVRVIVADARSGGLTLALQCNYPQFLPIMQVPQQKVDVLFANQAIIRFPHQALTPALLQLLQGGSFTIQGTGVPFFISEHLPILRRYNQISDDMVAKITSSNPIVSIATLRPTFTLSHRYENGVGKYITTATYQYQQQTLDMNALLAARGQNQRFVQQHAAWFEWPHNSYDLMNTLQQQRIPQVLRAEEVMGFDTRRVALLQNQPDARTIQPEGTTPVERGQSVFAQLRHHGIPGGIVGEPAGTATMFIKACEQLLRDNRQARILWLAPSNKKGSVTRAVNDSAIYSYVTVASLVTLRDEPALISHAWTLVIFQCLDQLLDGSLQSRALSRLKWQWTLTSVTSKRALSPALMHVMHLPEQYYQQFCTRYLFDLENSYLEPGQKPEQPPVQPGTNRLARIAGVAPVEKRVAVLRRYWHHFDEIHACQKEGMRPLWGLVEDSRSFDFEHRFRSHEPYQFQLYQQLLPSALLAEIEQLWGTVMLPRWPERIISEPFPHRLFAETYGPALKFWHGCALTAWFICEGPSSRTSLAEFAEYYSKDVQALKEMGTPINERLFEELARAEAQIGQPQPFIRQVATTQGNIGLTITATTSYGTQRKGFEKLRDIISSYRRQWAERYLDQYLQKRWETEISEAADCYKLYIQQKEIPSTTKQFAKDAKAAINHWFGGNINGLYAAIQEQSSLQPQRLAILPTDRVAFAYTAFKILSMPEDHSSEQKSPQIFPHIPEAGKLSHGQYYQLNQLAALSFWYVQLEEALGYTPTLKDFGPSRFSQVSGALNGDINIAWGIFSGAIEIAKRVLPTPGVMRESPKTVPENVKPAIARELTKPGPGSVKSTPSPKIRSAFQLNREIILKLKEESEQLQERLIVEAEEVQEQPSITSMPDPAPAATGVIETTGTAPEVDEDWQIILQQWRPEHWEIISLLCQKQSVQLTTAERKDHRPVSLLIDEINSPVDEQLGDLLIDPETQTISLHLQTVAESLVRWYQSSRGR